MFLFLNNNKKKDFIPFTKYLKMNITKTPSVSEAKIKSIFNFVVYQEVLDSCICTMVC